MTAMRIFRIQSYGGPEVLAYGDAPLKATNEIILALSGATRAQELGRRNRGGWRISAAGGLS